MAIETFPAMDTSQIAQCVLTKMMGNLCKTTQAHCGVCVDKAALTHRLTWAEAPGPTTIRGLIAAVLKRGGSENDKRRLPPSTN